MSANCHIFYLQNKPWTNDKLFSMTLSLSQWSKFFFVNKTFNIYSNFKIRTMYITLLDVSNANDTRSVLMCLFKPIFIIFNDYWCSWLSFTTCTWCNCSPGRVQSWCSQGRTCLLLLIHFLLNTYFTGFPISKCNFSRQLLLCHSCQRIWTIQHFLIGTKTKFNHKFDRFS